jgi:hypothetical protein
MLSALLVLELLLAAPPAGAAAPPSPDPLQWEVPGQVSVIEVPARMDVSGIPVRFRVVSSKEKVDYLLKHFARAFAEAGFYIPPPPRKKVGPLRLTALDSRTLTSYTVIFQLQPGGMTEVIVGEARLKDRQSSAPPMVPVYPGGKGVLQSNFEGARTLGYQVEAKEEEVKAWYQKELTRVGYKEEEPLLFRRKEKELRLSVTPQAGGVHVFLFLRETGEPPPLK